jgi:hypothetical protein
MRLAAILALLALAAGCDATRYYSGAQEKNVEVKASFEGSPATMAVYRLDSACTAQYEGVVDLDKPVIQLGLPTDRPSLLVFELAAKGLLLGNTSIKKEAPIRPRAGYRYEASASYRGSALEVSVREIDPRSGASRELDLRRRCG